MKKLIALVIALMLLALPVAHAFDLEGLSYEELVELKEQLNLAIWNSEEWQEVTVTQGVWEVGVDIPAGRWTILPAEEAYSFVTWCSELDENKISYGKDARIDSVQIKSPSRNGYKEGSDQIQVDWELTEGTYIVVEKGDIVFTPYTGKPDFGFK